MLLIRWMYSSLLYVCSLYQHMTMLMTFKSKVAVELKLATQHLTFCNDRKTRFCSVWSDYVWSVLLSSLCFVESASWWSPSRRCDRCFLGSGGHVRSGLSLSVWRHKHDFRLFSQPIKRSHTSYLGSKAEHMAVCGFDDTWWRYLIINNKISF